MLLVSRTLDFDRFRFKLPTRELLRVMEDGSETPIPLGTRAADVLLYFLNRPGELVTKGEIMQAVWPGAVVEESNLTVHISAIRRAIDDGRNGESCIQNVPRRGYRFTLDVTDSGAAAEGQNHRCVTYPAENAPVRNASSPSLEVLAAAPPLIASTGGGGGSSKTGGCTRLLRPPSCSSPVRQSSLGAKLLPSFSPSNLPSRIWHPLSLCRLQVQVAVPRTRNWPRRSPRT